MGAPGRRRRQAHPTVSARGVSQGRRFPSSHYAAHLSRHGARHGRAQRGLLWREGMLAYVKGVQRREIRRELAAVKHQDLAGSAVGDEHKAYFSKENALQAGGEANTMNQF